ncbi:MAG TPA: DUF3352 domain-containing protein [Pyrinomonadaceae bacterium]|jgi:hypothetical protein
MNYKLLQRLISLFVAIAILASPVLAQQRRNAPARRVAPAAPREPLPTFDSLFATETYKVYCEIRSAGALIQSPAVNELLDPVMKLSDPPREFKTALKWLRAHADVLAGSRVLIASWPARPELPNIVAAIEFASPEEAKKFYPELRDFIPKLIATPTPTPTPASVIGRNPSSGGPNEFHGRNGSKPVLVPANPDQSPTAGAESPTPSVPPYHLTLSGSLVLLSDKAFAVRDLRPRGSKPLEEDENFVQARTRFASESIFLYLDLKSIQKEEEQQQKKWEEEAQRRAEAEKENPVETETAIAGDTPPITPDMQPSPPENPPTTEPTLVAPTPDSQVQSDATLTAGPSSALVLPGLYTGLFAGPDRWPEAISAGLVAEGDSYIVRLLLINSAANKNNAVPFVPQFVSGPAIAPESPAVLPGDAELFVSFSLDYPQIYAHMLNAMADAAQQAKKFRRPHAKEEIVESPFAIYEQKLGLKIDTDLLPLLGNEFALVLPKKKKPATDAASQPADVKPPSPGDEFNVNPVIAIAVKDREAVGRLIPKLIEVMGLKGASLLAQSEKREGTEIVSYAGFFSYAFIENFLVLSPDPLQTRHAVDAYLSHETLSSDSHYRNFTRWQPRQVLGQIYVGPDLMEVYNPFARGLTGGVGNRKTNDFLARLSPLIEPTTYALTNDGSGPLHELHLPRNLLLWTIGATLGSPELSQMQRNESIAKGMLRTLHSAETSYQATTGNDGYGSLDQLISANLVSKDMLEKYGYRIEVQASGKKFEATAVPLEYGVTGTLSFFIDDSGELRGGDHGGGPASVADERVN